MCFPYIWNKWILPLSRRQICHWDASLVLWLQTHWSWRCPRVLPLRREWTLLTRAQVWKSFSMMSRNTFVSDFNSLVLHLVSLLCCSGWEETVQSEVSAERLCGDAEFPGLLFAPYTCLTTVFFLFVLKTALVFLLCLQVQSEYQTQSPRYCGRKPHKEAQSSKEKSKCKMHTCLCCGEDLALLLKYFQNKPPTENALFYPRTGT